MKNIEIDDDLYTLIASQTKHIGESASDILRRILLPNETAPVVVAEKEIKVALAQPQTLSPKIVEPEQVEDTHQVTESSDIAASADVFEVLAKQPKDDDQSRVEHFLNILSALHQVQPTQFDKVLSVSGRDRQYFAKDKDTLLKSGSSTNPKSIPASPYWVVTNNNTAKKVSMLKQASVALGYTESDVNQLAEIFNPA